VARRRGEIRVPGHQGIREKQDGVMAGRRDAKKKYRNGDAGTRRNGEMRKSGYQETRISGNSKLREDRVMRSLKS
jgi:hypothetical protein